MLLPAGRGLPPAGAAYWNSRRQRAAMSATGVTVMVWLAAAEPTPGVPMPGSPLAAGAAGFLRPENDDSRLNGEM